VVDGGTLVTDGSQPHMRIVVTGAAGFVGRPLVAALGTAHRVVAIDREPFGAGAAERDPALARAVNVDGTLSLIEAAAAAGQRPLRPRCAARGGLRQPAAHARATGRCGGFSA
jgi:nucleoside-diphosphate-sugar epimerase